MARSPSAEPGIRPIVCDWDATSHLPGPSRNSPVWRELLAGCDGLLAPVVLNRRLGELVPTALTAVAGRVWAAGEVPLVLGGDHRLTHAVLTAAVHVFPAVRVHQFDAHHDAHPAPSLTNYSFMRYVVDRLGCEVVRHGCREDGGPAATAPTHPAAHSYLTVDLDYFDPARFASVNYPVEVPAGEVYDLDRFTTTVATVAGGTRVIGADVVEWCADRASGEEVELVRRVLATLISVLRGAG